MKLTGTYNGKPIELELTEEQIEVLKKAKKKKTGWEEMEAGGIYWYIKPNGEVDSCFYGVGSVCENDNFLCANYFSDKTLAENVSRAQALQRKLWRRSAELCEKVDWESSGTARLCICYDYSDEKLFLDECHIASRFGEVYFDTQEHARQVAKEFHDELIWYFTEFQSRMD